MTSGQLTPVTHVVFDMDGLLINTEPLYEVANTTVCQRNGGKYTLEVKVKELGMQAMDSAKLVINELNLGITPKQYLAELDQEYIKLFDHVPLMPGAEKLVRHLHKHNIPIAIATSSKRQTFEMKTKNLKELFGLFDHIVICSEDPEVKKGKPAPDSYLVAASRFAVKPQSMKNVLVFEDAPAGVESGISAGGQVVWVPDSYVPRNLAKPTITVNSLTEFRPELFGLPKFDD